VVFTIAFSSLIFHRNGVARTEFAAFSLETLIAAVLVFLGIALAESAWRALFASVLHSVAVPRTTDILQEDERDEV